MEKNDGEEEMSEERSEEEQRRVLDMIKEAEAKIEQKKEFQRKNKNAADARPKENELRRLDSSIKKNTAFARKLRELSESKKDSLSNDFKSLNLTQYVQEAATNIAEAKLKVSDIGCAVHMCSLLHCRYADFAHTLTDQLQRIYTTGISSDEDKQTVTSKYRIGLRLIGELVISGIIDQDIAIALLYDMLNDIIKADKSCHAYTTVVYSFVRQYAEDISGILPRKKRLLLTKYGAEITKSDLIPEDKQSMFHTTLISYYDFLAKYLIHEHKEMHKRGHKNRQILQNKGELSSEREEANEKAQKAYEKLYQNVANLSEILDRDMPDLPEDHTPQEASNILIDIQLPGMGEEGEFNSSTLWEDNVQRSFYEDITDIKPFIPAILYEDSKRKKTASESSDGKEDAPPKEEGGEEEKVAEEEVDEEKILEEMLKETEAMSLEEDIEEQQHSELEVPEVITHSGKGGTPEPNALDNLLQQLPNMMNTKFVNDFAVNFCLNMNTKLNRQKLVKVLFNVDKNRMDLIPYYARLVATLHPCLPDVAISLTDMLMREIRFQIRKKDQLAIHTKIKNARFIAELTKFGMCSKVETMKCITLTVQDFTHHSVDMACTLIEHCGRYLLRSPDSHLRAKVLLEVLIRKKKIKHLNGYQKSLVEDAIYAANPPEVKPLERVLRPPLHEYIRLILYKELNKVNTEKILKQFRKLPWKDAEVFQWAVQCLSEAWNVKFSNIHCVANLLAGLKPYQDFAVIWVIDAVLEDIRLGLELNRPRMNQRRVAMIKFLGELYNYQLIESTVIFRTLYTLLSFGCNPDGTPGPLDPFDSYFRARLVCVLLDTCGMYFDGGSSGKRLDVFLVFFQCYMFSKRQPLPLEVEFMISDTLTSLRPDITLYSTPVEASIAAAAIEQKFRSKIATEEEEGGVDGGDDSDEEEVGVVNHESQEDLDEEEDENEGEDVEGEDSETAELDTYEDEDNQPVLKSGPKHIKCAEDDDFLTNFDKMIADSRKADTTSKVPTVDVAIPMNLRSGQAKPETKQGQNGEMQVKFKLVTKKGHKQQLKDINIPVDSGLVSSIKDTQQAIENEKQEMKRIVLDYERRQEEEDYQASVVKGPVIITKRPQQSRPQQHQPRPQQQQYRPQQQQQYRQPNQYYRGGGGHHQQSYQGRRQRPHPAKSSQWSQQPQ